MRRGVVVILILVGCGRSGAGAGGVGPDFVCGPGTHVAGGQCTADGVTGLGDDGGVRADGGGASLDGGAGDLAVIPPPKGSAVTYQIDPAHSGGQPASALRPPLVRRWSVTLGNTYLSYPLIVGDHVYVTGSGPSDVRLYALSAATGQTVWGPTTIATTNASAYAAWDDETLFVADSTMKVQAIDARSGTRRWTHSFANSNPVGAPVAIGGYVYVAANGSAFVFDERDGTLHWHGGLTGSPTSIAWTPHAVILEYVLGGTEALRPDDGASLWFHDCHCSGFGSGDVPVVYDGRVYAADALQPTQTIYRLSDGMVLGSYSSATIPAFDDGLGFFRSGSTVEAREPDGNVWWSFAGDGQLDSTPIAAGGFVYLGSTLGHLYAVDEVTGHQIWSDSLSAAVAPSRYDDGSNRFTGLAASSEVLIVPAGSTLTAYGN